MYIFDSNCYYLGACGVASKTIKGIVTRAGQTYASVAANKVTRDKHTHSVAANTRLSLSLSLQTQQPDSSSPVGHSWYHANLKDRKVAEAKLFRHSNVSRVT